MKRAHEKVSNKEEKSPSSLVVRAIFDENEEKSPAPTSYYTENKNLGLEKCDMILDSGANMFMIRSQALLHKQSPKKTHISTAAQGGKLTNCVRHAVTHVFR